MRLQRMHNRFTTAILGQPVPREMTDNIRSSSYSEGWLRTALPAAPITLLRPSSCSCISSPTQLLSRRRTALWTAECTRNCSSKSTTMFWTARSTSAWVPNGRSASLSLTNVPRTSIRLFQRISHVLQVSGSTILEQVLQAGTSASGSRFQGNSH